MAIRAKYNLGLPAEVKDAFDDLCDSLPVAKWATQTAAIVAFLRLREEERNHMIGAVLAAPTTGGYGRLIARTEGGVPKLDGLLSVEPVDGSRQIVPLPPTRSGRSRK